MGEMCSSGLFQGARNILINCAGMRPGQTLLIVNERSDDLFYGEGLLEAVVETAKNLGIQTEVFDVPFNPNVADPDPRLNQRIANADRTLFLARLGDQIRFRPAGTQSIQIVSYILDRQMLASDFGTADFRAFETLKHLINSAMSKAESIRVTCPAGTDFSGSADQLTPDGDVTIKRFPVSVFTPVPAQNFKGRIAQNGFLIGTGSHYYQPYAKELSNTLFVEFEGNRITGFEGNSRDVAAAKAHYESVGKKFDIDPFFVHSWHAGMHPGCEYAQPASENFERWSGGAFGNPRLLHFHTCGNYPPGEISLNIVDPTVLVDGVAVWENGVLFPERIDGGEAVLRTFPCAARTFQNPSNRAGLDATDRLSFGQRVA